MKMLYEFAIAMMFFIALGAMAAGSIQNAPECTPTKTIYERMRLDTHGIYGGQDRLLLWIKAEQYNIERGCPK